MLINLAFDFLKRLIISKSSTAGLLNQGGIVHFTQRRAKTFILRTNKMQVMF